MALLQHWMVNLRGSCHLLSGLLISVDRAARFWILRLVFKGDPWTHVSWRWTNLFSLTYLGGLEFNCRFFWESKWKIFLWAVCCKTSEGLRVTWKIKNLQSVSMLARCIEMRLKIQNTNEIQKHRIRNEAPTPLKELWLDPQRILLRWWICGFCGCGVAGYFYLF